MDVSANNGRLTFNSVFHTANNPAPNTSIVTGIKGKNCSDGECNIDASWGYKAANSVLNLKHNNTLNETSDTHAVGYSDFYFCLAPPKLVVKKQLNGTRIHDTDAKRDQFNIKVSGGTLNPDANNSPASFTTTGSGQTISNTSNLISLTPATTYTITESVLNGTNLGEITNYDTSYTCTNATAGSTMPSGATSSFTLSNLNYGDEVTCTITNTPKTYTFSGIVFNDNGGITGSNASATNANITTGPYANNSSYFNGIFNPTQETGVTGSTVKLVDCSTPSTVYATQAVSATGFYQISAPAITINSNLNNICLVEERSSDGYPIRTNNASKKITILASTYNYANNNFGRVIAENVALVLTKYQYINNCSTTLDYSNIGETATPSTGFSTASIDKIDPGKCIAYKITATNRANVNIDNFVMQDSLQKSGVNNATATSVLASPALDPAGYDSSSPAIGQNGTIKTRTLVLNPRTKRDFYFNTKYGTTVNPQ
ncbi:prealbumin-like fold domain-containing protein [Psychrobacter namhaensis]